MYYPQAMAQLKKTGIVVYIEAPLEEIKKRLRNIKTRGVAMEKGQTIEELYRIRKPLYEKFADITVTSDKNSPEFTVENIKKKTEALRKSD